MAKLWAKLKNPETLLFLFFLAIASFLMWKTFRVSPDGNLEIAVKVWSDFAANIPLIRSFSLGENFPPEYPLFPGEPIKYHFLFYAIVGILEKAGLPLDLALNIPSAIGFALLLALIYLTAKELFQKKAVAILSVILFLFNGSFSFLEFFRQHPISTGIIETIIKNKEFASFGPYDGKIVSAFWSLNIFTNQRHLALAYAIFLFFVYSFLRFAKNPPKFTYTKALLFGLGLGIFPFFHLAVFAMAEIAIGLFFLIYPKIRIKAATVIIVSVILAIPQILYLGGSPETSFFHPGYLIPKLSVVSFLSYWFLNLGTPLILCFFGLVLAKRGQRKFFLPFLVLFIVSNLFQFSPEIAANHKFFNLFLIGANFYAAYFLVRLWQKSLLTKMLALFYFFFLVLSGVIDIFPIVNDYRVSIPDYQRDPAAAFIYKNTPKNSVFINSTFFYDPASLAGRKIYLGWSYFPWSAGYDTWARLTLLKKMLNPQNKVEACHLLREQKIDFVEIQNPPTHTDLANNTQFYRMNFVPIYSDSSHGLVIYSVGESCNFIPLR